MAEQVLPIANGFYESGSLPISAQECVNWYPNIVEVAALSQETLFGTPGLTQLATTGSFQQINRGGWPMAGIPYFVNGESLYRLNFAVVDGVGLFTVDNLGTIEGSGRVSMSDNGTQLFILSPGGKGYIFTDGPDTLTEITDPDFRASGDPQLVVFVDGYFALTTSSKKFIVSALNDGLSYNALDFGTAEADPDEIVAPIVYKNQLFIGGSKTIEGFQNIGGAGFPFQRSGLYLSKGISAPFSVVNASDTFMFVGAGENERAAVWALSGSTTVKVSTTAIDTLIQSFDAQDVEGAFSWSYSENGAYFVGFSFPKTAIVYDVISKRWHERKTFDNGDLVGYRPNSFIQAYGRIICGDSMDGRIGELSQDVYTEYGDTIFRRVATQPFQKQTRSIDVPSLELTVESGVGDTVTIDPQVMMDISVDGGKSFRYERTRSLGKIGEYNHRAIWRRNGRMARFLVVRFTLTDPVKPVIIQLTADIL
jgi:hypothetical protein